MVSIIIGTRLDADEVWPAVAAWVADRSVSAVVAALQELSVPSSILGGCAHTQAVRTTRYGASARTNQVPVVADLSALWAGPLAAQLLGRAGAQLVTVEDVNRPDGARRGPAQFYHHLHADSAVLRLDLQSPAGRAALLSLVRDADIVIEASRPRALRRMGLVAEDLVAERPGRTWVSITGYGREAFDGNRVAFGDDAAVAGGLVGFDATGGPVFCADAVADPLTGLRAAIAVVSSQLAGGGHLIDVAMAGVSADVARPGGGSTVAHPITRTSDGRWAVSHEGVGDRLVAPPRQGRPW
jgi:crotonobetainyl-CoA:carnitine CoA-transferase CaiB-like acyl-CoA transferase